MRDHKRIFAAIGVILMIGLVAPVSGQIVYGQQPGGDLRLTYTHWTIKGDAYEDKLSQLMIPIGGFIPLKDNLEARLFAAEISNSLTQANDDYSLSGLSDVRLQLNQSLADDQILLSLGINLPTGKKSLEVVKERLVAEYLSNNFLTFPIRRLGEGFGFNFLAGAAGVSGDTRYGATASYQVNGAYEAYAAMGDYNPGDMLNLNAGLDSRRGNVSFIADMTFATFGVDKLEDHKVFRQSRFFDIHGGMAYQMGMASLSGDVRYLIRGRNTTYDATAADAIRDQLKIYGNELFFATGLTWSRPGIWRAGPLLEYRYIAANEYDFGASHTLAFGAAGDRKLGESLDAGLSVKYYTGAADDGIYDLSGLQVSLGCTATF